MHVCRVSSSFTFLFFGASLVGCSDAHPAGPGAGIDAGADTGFDAGPTAGDAGGSDDAPSDADASTLPDAVAPSTESGFFDVPAQPTAATYPGRLFYAFAPADSDPLHKPLALVFNGGPGFATSAGLLAYGTGPFTLAGAGDAAAPPSPSPTPNPASWTSFTNLLYLDMRESGFSYGLGPAPTTATFSEVEDASDFVRALLAFWALHPELEANPVLIVGESYGGVRAQYFLDLVLRYASDGALGGSDLPGLLQAHFDRIFPGDAGANFDEPTIATQFGHQVLIQPLVLGSAQSAAQAALLPSDPYVGGSTPCFADAAACDPLDVNEPPGWSDGLTGAAALALSSDETATPFLGTRLEAIAPLLPAARATAFREADPVFVADAGAAELAAANAALTQSLGALRAGDQYYVPQIGVAWGFGDDIGGYFEANLLVVRTFITDARFDPDIFAPAIPAALQDAGLGGVIDDAPRTGVARPGWFSVTGLPFPDGGAVEVRFPPYVGSGHMVAVMQAQDLHDDVAAWMAE